MWSFNKNFFKSGKNLNEIKIKEYLQNHPEFLDNYVLSHVEPDHIQTWLERKKNDKNRDLCAVSIPKSCMHSESHQMIQDLSLTLQHQPTKYDVLVELGNCISSAINADGFTLFLADEGDDSLYIYMGQNARGEAILTLAKTNEVEVPLYVARQRKAIRLSRNNGDYSNYFKKKPKIGHILCQSIQQPDGKLIAVIEFFKHESGYAFQDEDEDIAYSYIIWGGIALHYAILCMNMNKNKKLNDFLLMVVRSIFQDMVSMELLVPKIMNYAQRLVDADRASLFLVDSKQQELYATVFDVGNDEQQEGKSSPDIRFKMGTGIAGIVAETGKTENIKDAYSDPRFNHEIDKQTGYKTKSILCMPLFNQTSIIGVVQMVNKRNGFFTEEDEKAFEMFAVYCGLAVHHTKLYDKIRKSEQKYKVALEVLSYHSTCAESEVQRLVPQLDNQFPIIDDYHFNSFAYGDDDKVCFAVHMFEDLFGLRRFDRQCLIRFTLTIRKNYRNVPYHNWSHGFSVANTMYTLIKKTSDVFRPIECLALYIAALCHDLDHRGKNNKFMADTESPLAAIYSTSTMEHHHFNQTVAILQNDGHNIFSKLSYQEYKQALSLIKHCILATDLALFFPNKSKLTVLIETEKFTWSSKEHRLMIQGIVMTASDLSASAKPWDVQEKTVKIIFEEFYDQGDAERKAGKTPIPMMDREQPNEQANSQVGFLSGICLPCYKTLYKLIPETKPLLDMVQFNLNKWRKIAANEETL
ncbi:hypothetical protein ACFFRR_004462 [Megaselia abdita]